MSTLYINLNNNIVYQSSITIGARIGGGGGSSITTGARIGGGGGTSITTGARITAVLSPTLWAVYMDEGEDDEGFCPCNAFVAPRAPVPPMPEADEPCDPFPEVLAVPPEAVASCVPPVPEAVVGEPAALVVPVALSEGATPFSGVAADVVAVVVPVAPVSPEAPISPGSSVSLVTVEVAEDCSVDPEVVEGAAAFVVLAAGGVGCTCSSAVVGSVGCGLTGGGVFLEQAREKSIKNKAPKASFIHFPLKKDCNFQALLCETKRCLSTLPPKVEWR